MNLNFLVPTPGTGGNWAGQTQSPNNYYFTSDSLGEAALYALIGFIIVFVGIALIIAIIWIVGIVMKKTNNLEFLTSGKKKKGDKRQIKAEENATADEDVSDEVKAAIIAAIMAYYSEEKPKCEFTVRRIKRI